MRVLIIDSDATSRWLFYRALKEHVVVDCASLEEARVLLKNSSFDVIFLARNLPDGDGFALLDEFRGLSFVVVCINPALERVRDAVAKGAIGYIKKPLDVGKIREFLSRLNLEEKPDGFETEIVVSGSLISKVQRITSYVSEGMPFLIYGEHGVGKSTLLNHTLISEGVPFKVYDANVSMEKVLEAFNGGASYVVLERSDQMCSCFQERLYRCLLNESISPRVVLVFTGDPLNCITEGTFKEELYAFFGSRVLEIEPLRNRKDEIPVFVEHFRHRWQEKEGIEPPRFSEDAMKVLLNYRWPGNLTELKNVLFDTFERLSGVKDVVGVSDLPTELLVSRLDLSFVDSLRRDVRRMIGQHPQVHRIIVDVVERVILEEALAAGGGSRVKAAEVTGLHRNTITNKIKRLFGGVKWILER